MTWISRCLILVVLLVVGAAAAATLSSYQPARARAPSARRSGIPFSAMWC